ncbi:MAG: glycosyltransferase family 2 protein [Sphingobacteriaceae bacterium]|nr:glycosyltransferase family 2 protein [Sphingobacteriaceae bacterium]
MYIGKAIDSVLCQSYINIELLVADDYSTDQTRKIIESYNDQRIKVFHNSENMGYLKTCNMLVTKASGSFLTFLDADDINHPLRFEKLINHFIIFPKLSCIGSNIVRIDPHGNVISHSDFPHLNIEIKTAFENYRIPCHFSSLLIKMDILEKVGMYNEYWNRIGSEDVYWFSHILHYFKTENLPEELYYYRKHSTSVTATHKDPKAFIGHQLIIHLYKRRLKGKEDYIQSGNWKKADACAKYLMAINKTRLSAIGSIVGFIGISIVAPSLFPQFIRKFVSNWRANFKWT